MMCVILYHMLRCVYRYHISPYSYLMRINVRIYTEQVFYVNAYDTYDILYK